MKFTAHYSGSKGNLYSVESEQCSTLLIDPGVNYSRLISKVDLTKVCGALISHSHLDHCKAVPKLLERGVTCFASVPTIKALGQRLRFESITANRQYQVADFYFKPFEVKHDAPGTVGFVIADECDKLLYVTDTPYIQPRFQNLTIIAVECNYSNDSMVISNPGLEVRIRNNHMGLDATVELLRSQDLAQVREIWLLHLSDANSHAENFIKTIQKVTGKPVYIA